MFGGPRYQSFRGIAPFQSERGFQDGLPSADGNADQKEDRGSEVRPEFPRSSRIGNAHKKTFSRSVLVRKPRTRRSGFALVEATLALSILSVVGLLLLKLSLNVIHPRQYALQQILSDSYMTFERAQAERISFDELTGGDSLWPVYPDVAVVNVQIGALPGGVPVIGEVTRTRVADTNNYPRDGDENSEGTVETNPAAMKIWKIQSVLRYRISDRTYLKSRTLVRAQ